MDAIKEVDPFRTQSIPKRLTSIQTAVLGDEKGCLLAGEGGRGDGERRRTRERKKRDGERKEERERD